MPASSRAPLTRTDLRRIWQRSPTRDTRDLLWEIHRLRAIALRSDQLLPPLLQSGAEARLDQTTKLITGALWDALRGEPAVAEAEEARRVLLERTRKK